MAARPSKPRRISVTPTAIKMRTPGPGVIIPAAPRSHGATLAGSRPHQRGHVHRQQVRSRSIPFRPCSEALLAAVGPARCAAGSPKRSEPEPTAPEPQRPAAPAANGRSDSHKSRCVARGPGCEFQVTTIAPPSPHETQHHALGDDRYLSRSVASEQPLWQLHLYQPSGHAAPVPRRETRSRGRTLTSHFAPSILLRNALAIRFITCKRLAQDVDDWPIAR